MDFVRKIATTTAKGKKGVGITLLRKRDGVERYSTPEVKEVFLAQKSSRSKSVAYFPKRKTVGYG
jgi:hypothetical protein